jgi:predicted transcriptional regulator
LRLESFGDLDSRSEDGLPDEIRQLFPRMREIASIIYQRGGATVREIQASIDDPLTICGIRTLLIRMERRGLVRHRRSGRHSELFYLPAVVTDDVRQNALKCFVDEQFEGSAAAALRDVLRLIHEVQVHRGRS